MEVIISDAGDEQDGTYIFKTLQVKDNLKEINSNNKDSLLEIKQDCFVMIVAYNCDKSVKQ